MTPKQQRFVEEYLVDLNATQAAIRAGYSARTAEQQGSRLLSNAKVARGVANAQAARSEQTGIDATWVLQRLGEEAVADLADLYDEQGNLRRVHEWPLIWRQGLVAGVETVNERVGVDEEGNAEYAIVKKVKLSDRIKRVELIGRHVGVQAFKDKLEVEDVTDRAAIIAEARRRAGRGD